MSDGLRDRRILVVDDEGAVRRTAVAMLRRMGALAEGAEDCEEALRVQRASLEAGRPFELALVDMTLQRGPQGEEVARALRLADPSLLAVATSGYTESGAMTDPRSHGFVGALAKPYTLTELRRALETALPRRS